MPTLPQDCLDSLHVPSPGLRDFDPGAERLEPGRTMLEGGARFPY